MRRLNIKLLVSLVVGLLVMVASVHVIHGIQVDKNAGILLEEAKKADTSEEAGLRVAVKKYGQYLKHRPTDVAAQEKFALLANDLANLPGATQDDLRLAYRALDVAAKHPELVEVRRRIIDYYIRLARYVDAVEYLEKLRAAAQESGKREPVLDVKLARCEVVLGHHDKAQKILNELVGFDKKAGTFDVDTAVAPWEIEAYMVLADVLRRRLDDPEQADAVMQQMVVANPDSADAYLRLGRYEVRQGKPEKALGAFDRALELAPEDPDVILEVADIAITRKDFDRARPLLETGLKEHPDNGEIYRSMAALTLAERKENYIDEAVKLVETGLEHAPKSPTLMVFLVDLQMMRQDVPAAKEAIERMRAAQLPPEFVSFYEAALLVEQHKWPAAASQLERLRPLMARWPDRVFQIDLALGQCYEALGQPDRQAEAYRRVLDLVPSYPAALVGHARAMMSLGKRKEGMAELKKVDQGLRSQNVISPIVRASVLQGRVAEQMNKPADERKWDDVDEIVQEMVESDGIDEVRKGLIQVEIASLKGNIEEARELAAPLLEAHPESVPLWLSWFAIEERLANKDQTPKVLQSAEEREAAMRESVDVALARVAEGEKGAGDQPSFRVLRAAAVARLGGDEAKEKLAALEEGIDKFTPDEQATIWDGLGNAYQRLRDYENVKRCYQKLVDRNPDDLHPWEKMFDVAMIYGDDAGAQEATAEIRRVSGAGSATYKYCIATQLVGKVVSAVAAKDVDPTREKKRIEESRKLVDEIRRVRPDWHQPYRLEGEIDDLEGHVDAAIGNYQKAIDLGSTNPNAARRLVLLLFQQQRMSEVQAALKHLGRESSNPMMEKIDVESKFRTGDRETALQMAKDSVAAIPADANPQDAANRHVWYANLLEADSRPEEAEEQYRAALKLQPESSSLWTMLIQRLAAFSRQAESAGKSSESARRKAEAMEAIEDAKKSVAEKELPAVLAQAYEAVGDIDQAEEFRVAVLKENPENLNESRNIASFYLRHGMVDKARTQIEAILASKLDDRVSAANRAWARRSLAELLARKGDFTDVQKAIQLVQQNTSDGRGTVADVRFIAEILAQRPDSESRDRAVQLYEQLADQQALSAQERLGLASLYDRAGNWPKAREQMLALVSRMPKDAIVLSNWIQMLLAHDEVQNLDKWIEKLDEAAPKSDLTIRLKMRWLAKQEKTQEAVDYAKSLVADQAESTEPLKPEQVVMLGKVAGILEELKDYSEAEQYMRQWYENDPGQVLALAAYLGRHGKADEAFTLYGKVREAELEAAGLLKDATASAASDEKPDKEGKTDEKPAEPARQLIVPSVFVAAVQTVRANPGKATAKQQKLLEQWLLSAINDNPNFSALALLLVDLKDIQGKFNESIKLYRDLLAGEDLTERQRAIVQNNLAYLLVTRGTKENLEEAQTLVDKAVAHFGPIGGVLDTRGMLKLTAGDGKAALDDFKVAVARRPSAVNFLHVAMAEDELGNATAASEAFARAEELNLDAKQLCPSEQQDYKRWHKEPAKSEKDAAAPEKDQPTAKDPAPPKTEKAKKPAKAAKE